MNAINIEIHLLKSSVLSGKVDASSFFSIENEEDVANYSELFDDHLTYIPGAIIIDVYGERLLSYEDWDAPFSILYQFSDQLELLSKNEPIEALFAESPRALILEPKPGEKYLLQIKNYDEIVRKKIVSAKEFDVVFFTKIIKLFQIAERFHPGKNKESIIKLQEFLRKN